MRTRAITLLLWSIAAAPAFAQSPPEAVVQAVSRRVEHRRAREPWAPAPAGSELGAGDGVRTARRSSAAVSLEGGGFLRVSEASTVFVRETPRRAGEARRAAVEVTEGEADLKITGSADVAIEALRVHTRAGEAATHVRVRRTKAGLAQVMAYAGTVDAETPGGRVAVPAGTGTTARRYDAPRAPEVLLLAPSVVEPTAAAALDHSNPTFRWRAVQGAETYVVEVCADEECGVVVERASGVNAPAWGIARLPLGAYWWRVTPVAPSGLDGYPAKATSFEVKALWRRPPPVKR